MRFWVRIGPFSMEPRLEAERLLTNLIEDPHEAGVLILLGPEERRLEVMTTRGREAAAARLRRRARRAHDDVVVRGRRPRRRAAQRAASAVRQRRPRRGRHAERPPGVRSGAVDGPVSERGLEHSSRRAAVASSPRPSRADRGGPDRLRVTRAIAPALAVKNVVAGTPSEDDRRGAGPEHRLEVCPDERALGAGRLPRATPSAPATPAPPSPPPCCCCPAGCRWSSSTTRSSAPSSARSAGSFATASLRLVDEHLASRAAVELVTLLGRRQTPWTADGTHGGRRPRASCVLGAAPRRAAPAR